MASVPATMRIIEIRRPGGPDVLVPAERPVPAPGPGEILIKVAAAGLNRADVLQRLGGYPVPKGAPEHPGLEVSGTVAVAGEGVTAFAVGDAVCALLQGGGYGEYCVAPVAQVLRIPKGLDFIQAASLPEAAFTVWSNVFEFGRLAPGQSLLVHGGSSGIGVTAIQLASALGHAVYATAGSDDKCRFCESLGARRGINYKSEDFSRVILEETERRGVDVILDMVGASYLMRNVVALAPEGRLVVIALISGSTTPVDLYQLMAKRVSITGSLLRPRDVAFKAAIKAKLEAHVWPLLDSGRLRPIVDRVFPLDEAGKAQAYMESSAHRGKIILSVP
jgi:NADPH2:quinone reductase